MPQIKNDTLVEQDSEPPGTKPAGAGVIRANSITSFIYHTIRNFIRGSNNRRGRTQETAFCDNQCGHRTTEVFINNSADRIRPKNLNNYSYIRRCSGI